MNIKYLLSVLIFAVAMVSCDGYDGDSYDFSNSLPNYVEFSSIKALSVAAGANAAFTVVTRSSYSKDVNVTVKIEGGSIETASKVIVLKKMTTSIASNFTIPASTPSGSGFKITIVSASSDGIESIRLGRVSATTTVINGTVK